MVIKSKYIRRVLKMNKLTKQLLSLGLSAVTVAGMVTPVLADDEVPTTELEATEVTDQPTENGKLCSRRIRD